MNAKTKSDSKHSGHALRDQFVTMVAKFFADSGWDVFYDPQR